jgi:hypothetical protein
LFHLVFESHDGRALVPIPKRSTSLRATSTLEWWIGLKALDPDRPIREATIMNRNAKQDIPVLRKSRSREGSLATSTRGCDNLACLSPSRRQLEVPA